MFDWLKNLNFFLKAVIISFILAIAYFIIVFLIKVIINVLIVVVVIATLTIIGLAIYRLVKFSK